MWNIIWCTVSLGLANFGVEAFREIPDYLHAASLTWNELLAISVYHYIWVKDQS
jgi:hypothetical protein